MKTTIWMKNPIWVGLCIGSLGVIIFLMLRGISWMLGVIRDMTWFEYGMAFAIFITAFTYSYHKIRQEDTAKENEEAQNNETK